MLVVEFLKQWLESINAHSMYLVYISFNSQRLND